MSNLNEKATKAAARYLDHRGYTVLETVWKCPAGTSDIVAEDEGVLVFVDVSVREESKRGFPTELNTESLRERREEIAFAWLTEHEDVVDVAIRFDNIAMLLMGSDRAMIRHHVNALGGAVEQMQPQAAAGIPTGTDQQALPEAA